MQTDVKSAYTESDAAVVPYRTRLKSLFFICTTAGTDPIIVYDDASGATGDVLLKVGTTAAGGNTVLIPGEGILARNGVYVDTGDADSVTVFYG